MEKRLFFTPLPPLVWNFPHFYFYFEPFPKIDVITKIPFLLDMIVQYLLLDDYKKSVWGVTLLSVL